MTPPVPHRVQRRRTAGWRKPENTVVVTRPGRWGNPHIVGAMGYPVLPGGALGDSLVEITPQLAVDWHRNQVLADPEMIAAIRLHLRGRNLACWCGPGRPCHADTLLLIANCSEKRLAKLVDHRAPAPLSPSAPAGSSRGARPRPLDRKADPMTDTTTRALRPDALAALISTPNGIDRAFDREERTREVPHHGADPAARVHGGQAELEPVADAMLGEFGPVPLDRGGEARMQPPARHRGA